MRIGILTQPIHTNYGGILQAFALQTILTRLGHEVYIINRDNRTWLWLFLHRCIRFYYDLTGRDYVCPMNGELVILQRNLSKFINKELHLTKRVNTSNALRQLCKELYLKGYVVGSDQVWRPKYSPNIGNYFLDFTTGENVKRVAYAASLGTDNWAFTKSETIKCKNLTQKFNGISVREESAVKLCRKNLEVDAIHVLDPTMLLEAVDYAKFCTESQKVNGELFAYFLDDNSQKRKLLLQISKQTQMKPFFCMPPQKATTRNLKLSPADCVFPGIDQWINSFVNAKMVVTDSFHGCVFSIIFNKPFWVCGNQSRGNARFNSLLSLFSLQNRLIDCDDTQHIDMDTPVDWKLVNERITQLRAMSLKFLIDSLK